ncbi:MFS transporter [Vitreoscilla massiliensis]|uniref:MFS transporter n=1 Tax=Vitreoscilla massiliensis TaxID=1689272 RepID=A0ABY4DYQ5_9NEIS|nr:MFS transporter [Vitreoscilla massiliensis]UOO88442.1 MFS transporter [Vitreoscilla massiliensis]
MMQSFFQNTYSRLFLILLTMGSFSLGMTEYSMIGFSDEMSADLQLSSQQTSQVMSAYALGVLIGAPLLAILGSKLNRHTLLAYLLFWCASANFLTSFAESYEQLRLLRVFNGFPHGIYFSTAALLIYEVFPKHKRASYIGVMFSGIGMALIMAVPFNTWVGEVQGWRYMYRFMALVDLLILVLLHNLSPALPLQHQRSLRMGLLSFKNPVVWWILLIGACVISGKVSVLTYAEHIALDLAHLHESQFPLIILCVGLGMASGSLVGGKLASIHLHRTLLAAICWVIAVMVMVQLCGPHMRPACMWLFTCWEQLRYLSQPYKY